MKYLGPVLLVLLVLFLASCGSFYEPPVVYNLGEGPRNTPGASFDNSGSTEAAMDDVEKILALFDERLRASTGLTDVIDLFDGEGHEVGDGTSVSCDANAIRIRYEQIRLLSSRRTGTVRLPFVDIARITKTSHGLDIYAEKSHRHEKEKVRASFWFDPITRGREERQQYMDRFTAALLVLRDAAIVERQAAERERLTAQMQKERTEKLARDPGLLDRLIYENMVLSERLESLDLTYVAPRNDRSSYTLDQLEEENKDLKERLQVFQRRQLAASVPVSTPRAPDTPPAAEIPPTYPIEKTVPLARDSIYLLYREHFSDWTLLTPGDWPIAEIVRVLNRGEGAKLVLDFESKVDRWITHHYAVKPRGKMTMTNVGNGLVRIEIHKD